ncbi:ABC transporter permease [Agrococcus sp. HG114]|uniref:ABC transporter permease n=1 Tax=Agrococcus sp. HG114 TaxID=2969757 RepID=UPI00215AB16A|nr:ABC transporter permease [Agrococcus sp. HG114]MCR8671351.1 ABC transporter permease [Agrococcus sp. HG114]
MREALVSPLRIAGAATRIAVGDLRAVYSPLSWGVGWLGRVLSQVLFFAIIGLLLQDPDLLLRLALGQAVLLCWLESMLSVQSTGWERSTGSFPLLVAAPGALWPVLVGRSVQWMGSALATSSIALFALCTALGVRWTAAGVLLALLGLVATALGGYAVGLAVGAAVLHARRWRNVVPNVLNAALVATAGVTVPTEFWPPAVQWAVQALPLPHALAFVRGAAAGSADPAQLCAALALAAGWLVVACCSLGWFVHAGRRDGSIAFDE